MCHPPKAKAHSVNTTVAIVVSPLALQDGFDASKFISMECHATIQTTHDAERFDLKFCIAHMLV